MRRVVVAEAVEEGEGGGQVGAAGPLAEEIRGPQHGDLFGDRDIDELVEGGALGLGQALGFGLDRRLQREGRNLLAIILASDD